MLISPRDPAHESATPAGAERAAKRWLRRATTALEYMVCASMILVVLIAAVQHLGSMIGNKFANNAKATESTLSTGS